MKFSLPLAVLFGILSVVSRLPTSSAADPRFMVTRHDALAAEYIDSILGVMQRRCFECHSADHVEAGLDLAAIRDWDSLAKQPETWQKIHEAITSGEMPPADAPAIDPKEKTKLQSFSSRFLAHAAKELAGDPGPMVMRRLNNAQFNFVVRDLTGLLELEPAKEFPADSGAGEGFTSSGGAQSMSPALLQKYLDAAKAVSEHLVLLPDGIRFSESTTRRDQTEEILARIRKLYSRYTVAVGATQVNLQGIVFETNGGGRLPIERYLEFIHKHRSATLPDTINAYGLEIERQQLSTVYLGKLHEVLQAEARESDGVLLNEVKRRWQSAGNVSELTDLVKWISQCQQAVWKFTSVGHIGKVGGPKAWMEPVITDSVREIMRQIAPGTTHDQMEHACEQFRSLFPAALCYVKIVPVDEVVTLTLYYREDEPLKRLMLDEKEVTELERLWAELWFVSEAALASVDAYEQLWQYATQDADPSAFEPLRQPLLDRAAEFRQQKRVAEPKQLEAIGRFAERAFRRPLSESQRGALTSLYTDLRNDGLSHADACRFLISRVLISPAFMFRNEVGVAKAVTNSERSLPLDDFEIATRLSFFLWSSIPDQELFALAAEGRLGQPHVLQTQVERMLRDPRAERLASEFASQWFQVYQFDQHDEKSETSFPQFVELRGDMYQEALRDWGIIFQENRSILDFINADATFVNDRLAAFYGIEPVRDVNSWREVSGMHGRGRGGVLGLAAVLAKQSGASRTSPILRGNWVSEVLLGDKLPRPPKNVPPLPEALPEGLTERELTERHSTDPACAKCHQQIDPLGYALEGYDAIGRQRTVQGENVRTKLMDGEIIEGLSGLREYLLHKRRADFVRQFCRKLLGFALGRSVRLSDQGLLEEMQATLEANDYRSLKAIVRLVTSEPFLRIRGHQNETVK